VAPLRAKDHIFSPRDVYREVKSRRKGSHKERFRVRKETGFFIEKQLPVGEGCRLASRGGVSDGERKLATAFDVTGKLPRERERTLKTERVGPRGRQSYW